MVTLMLKPRIDTKGAWVLGHTQQQGGSILHSGARAEFSPSRLTHTLSNLYGRMAARTMSRMGRTATLINYATLRPRAMIHAIDIALQSKLEGALVVDPAAGYSPQFIWHAEMRPKTHFIEIDTADVINDKTARLHEAQIPLPQNLEFIIGDLRDLHLHSVLDDREADVVLAIGAYVQHDDFRDLLRYLKQVMSAQGTVIATLPYKPGIQHLYHQNWLFRRFAGIPEGVVESKEQAIELLTSVGYRNIRPLLMTDIATALDKPQPANVEIVLIADV